jgi:hypothetical protein
MENMFLYQGRQVFWGVGPAGSIEVRVKGVFFIDPDTYEMLLDMAEEDQIWANLCRKSWDKIIKSHGFH